MVAEYYWGRQAFAERMLKLAQAALKGSRSRNDRGSLERKAHAFRESGSCLAEGLRAAGLNAVSPVPCAAGR